MEPENAVSQKTKLNASGTLCIDQLGLIGGLDYD